MMKFKLLVPDQSGYILTHIVGVNSFQEVIDLSAVHGVKNTPLGSANGLKKQFEKGYFNKNGVTSLVCAIFSRFHNQPKEIKRHIALLFEELDPNSGGLQAIKWVNELLDENMTQWRKGKEQWEDWSLEMNAEGRIPMEERRPVVMESDKVEEGQAEIILPTQPEAGRPLGEQPKPEPDTYVPEQTPKRRRKRVLFIALSVIALFVAAAAVWYFNQDETSPMEANQAFTEEQQEQPTTDPAQTTETKTQEPASTGNTIEGNQINFGDNNQIENSTISGGDAHVEPKK